MKISYCTTCKDRLWQVVQTLEHNLSFTKSGVVDICLLFYNDEISYNYIYENFNEYIKDGRLKIFLHLEDKIFKDGTDWSCGYVKHLVHLKAQGEVLFNLDADNFIDENLQEKLFKLTPSHIIITTRKEWLPDGRSGRIGINRSLYLKIEGYRDKGKADDGDFIFQCLAQRCKFLEVSCLHKPISNNK